MNKTLRNFWSVITSDNVASVFKRAGSILGWLLILPVFVLTIICENIVFFLFFIVTIFIVYGCINTKTVTETDINSFISTNCETAYIKDDLKTIVFKCDNGQEYTRDELVNRLKHGE